MVDAIRGNAIRRTGARRLSTGQKGGTLVGLAIGLLVGLAIAVVVTLYMSRSPVPFVDKIKRPGDRPEAATPADVPDPNRSMQKNRPASTEPPVAVTPPAAPGTDAPSTAPAAPGTAASNPPGAPASPGAPTAPPTVLPAAPSAAVTETPVDKTTYLLQAGAFKGQEDAEAMKVKLALVGFEARIVMAEVNGVTFYRVRVGPYGQLDDLNRARTRLAENGVEASVVRQK
ncbi:MAG: SPOR domain-containing protein [Burkholderiales bacterium]